MREEDRLSGLNGGQITYQFAAQIRSRPLRAFADAEGLCVFSSGVLSSLSPPFARRRAAGLHLVPRWWWFRIRMDLTIKVRIYFEFAYVSDNPKIPPTFEQVEED